MKRPSWQYRHSQIALTVAMQVPFDVWLFTKYGWPFIWTLCGASFVAYLVFDHFAPENRKHRTLSDLPTSEGRPE